ncbi:dihydroneopterin aldolase [Calidifontibacillus oryziterrae]|uniref:dihydroneopterin aldolase n=1 Tax=Calidifontibacillus oryziterrae TaxID=1191699 RepID=UPI00037F0322|nr:dihydroneopterin aldolase [Calidifontibacillus oryziterrae]
MDKIYLNGMEFYGYHGVLPEETTLGQRFLVNVILELDLSQAGNTDNLEQTVNYALVYELIKGVLEGEPHKLIERVAEQVAKAILSSFARVDYCTVNIIKPNPPIRGHYKSVAVEIRRGRA